MRLSKPGALYLGLRPILMSILWFDYSATLVEPAIANDAGHHSINVLVRPFFLAVFGECQLVAENMHAAEIGFERADQGCPIDLGEQGALDRAKSDDIGRKVLS